MRTVRTSQPQGAVGIDWGNPITRGLQIVRVGADRYDVATGITSVSGAVATSVGLTGKAASYTAGSSDGFRYTSSNLTTSPATVFVVCMRRGTNAASLRLYSEANATTAGFDIGNAGSSSNISLTVGGSVSNAQTIVQDLFLGDDGKVLRIAITYDGVFPSPTIGFYKNGAKYTTGFSVVSAGSGTQNARSTNSMFGNYALNPTGVPRAWNGDIYLGLVFNRALSDAEIKSLSDNPWQIFQPVSRAIWVPVAAAGGSPDATVNLTGVSATGAVGTVVADGGATNANATPTGVSATGTVGTVSATGTATVNLTGVAGTGAVGTTTQSASANITPTGASASGLAGILSLFGTANTAVTGVSGAGAAGTVTASSAVTATIGRPVSDASNAGWTASTGSDLYAMVDEVTPSSADYISASSVGAICALNLNPTAYPGSATSQNLKYRASSSTGNSVIVRIKNGATTIRSQTQALTVTDTEYTITLTSGEIAAIASGSLSVELESA